MTGVNTGSAVHHHTNGRGQAQAGPMRPTSCARTAVRPVDYRDVVIAGGFWGARQERNRVTSIPIGSRRLRDAGNLENLRLSARPGDARASYLGPVFMGSDIYKWLEAVSREFGRAPDPQLAAELAE